MTRVTKIKIVVVAVGIMLSAIVFTGGRSSAQTQVETAGQKFKNIKVLNDMPADQMGQVMNIMSASLGVDCKMCHVSNDKDFEKDGIDHKDIARKMIKMTWEINKTFFEGKPEVSCNTCHVGHERPVALPSLLPPAPPVERPKQPAVKPTVDEILAKYETALGGKDALARVKSRYIKANRVEPDGKTVEPEEIWLKGGKYRSETKYGDYLVTELFDGKDARKLGNTEAIELKAFEAEQMKRDAQLFANPDIRSIYAKLDFRFLNRIDGREVYMVTATTADNRREQLAFDVLTGQLVRRVASAMTVIGQFQYQVDYSDYKDLGGVKLPASTRFAMPGITWTRKIVEVKNNTVDDAKFTSPK